MEFNLAFFSSLLMVIFIDLALSGDNAVVIAMAANRLPTSLRMKAIYCGVAGAVGLRILATVFILYLLSLPWLRLVGGLMLVYISYKLLLPESDEDKTAKDSSKMWKAILFIIWADASMALDNMIGVAGAADGNQYLVIFGLILSIPITVTGSTVILRFMDRFPWIVYVGSAILSYTAVHMILQEPSLKEYIHIPYLKEVAYTAVVGITLLAGKAKRTEPNLA